MTDYYVSPDGNNANNGLGPDASHATNKPWLTLAKALNTGSTVVPGDVVHVAPGEYFSEVLVPIAGITSSASPTEIRGDPFNKKGFKDGSGVRRAPGVCYVTTRTSGERDSVPAAASDLITLSTNDPDGLIFRDLILDGGIRRVVLTDLAGSEDLYFYDCILITGGSSSSFPCVTYSAAAAISLTHRYVRCTFLGGVRALSFDHTTAASAADVDLDVAAHDCIHISGLSSSENCFAGTSSAQAGNKFGGIVLDHCHTIGGSLLVTASGHSTVTASRAKGCLLIAGSRFFNANASGQLADDGYNRGVAGPREASINVTEAGTTKRAVMANIFLPHLCKWGFMPTRDVFGWLPAAHADQKFSASSTTRSDFFDGQARPWAGGASIGAIQARDIAQNTGSKFVGGGANSLEITGAGDVVFRMAVNAVPTTVSVKTESDGSYSGGSWPQLIVKAEPDLGINADLSDTAGSASEETLTTASFTPTKAGIIEIVLRSRSATGTSKTWWDDLTRNE